MLDIKDFKLNDCQTYTNKHEEHMLIYAQYNGVKFEIMRLLMPEDDFTRSWQLNIDDQDHGSHQSIAHAIDMCNEYIKDHKLNMQPKVVIEINNGIVQSVRCNRKDTECMVFYFDDKGEETEADRMDMEDMYKMNDGMYHIW